MSSDQDPRQPPEGGTTAPEEEAMMSTLLRAADPSWPPEEPARSSLHAHWQAALRRRRRRPHFGLAAAALVTVVASVGVLRTLRWEPDSNQRLTPTVAVAATVERVIEPEPAGGDPGVAALRVGGEVAWAGSPIALGTSVETSPLGLAALRVAGQSVRLAESTRIELVGANFVRLERGAIYVDSHDSGPERPAIQVLTPLGSVREVGTQFEVRLAENSLRVRVREGAVVVRTSEGGQERLRPRQELLVSSGAAPAHGRVSLTGGPWSWAVRVAPTPPLDGAKLGDLLSWVRRETGAEVVFARPADAVLASQVVLHGELQDLDPEQAVAVVLPTCGLRGVFEAGRLVIYSRE